MSPLSADLCEVVTGAHNDVRAEEGKERETASLVLVESPYSLVPRPPRPAVVACSTKCGGEGRPGLVRRSHHVIRAMISVATVQAYGGSYSSVTLFR